MSFFSSLKRGLGFGGDDDDDDDDRLLADDSDTAAAEPDTAPSDADRPLEVSADARARIFESVVKVFDAALPDFLARSVDQAAQREYLLGALDKDLRAYLDSLSEAADARCRREWESRQAALTAELDSVRAKSAELERQSADTRQKQLSADRQKRALSDRVHDLESVVGKLEAEREQYELENRSLVNRLKVAGVREDDADAARAEIDRLKAEVERLRNLPEAAADPAETEALRRQVAEMTDGIEALKEQQRVSSEMLDDERRRLAEATAGLATATESLSAATEELAAVRDEADGLRRRVADTDARLAEATEAGAATATELEDCRRRLEEANALLDGFNELQHKMEEVDRALRSRDTKIKRLKQQLAERDSELETLRSHMTADTPAAYAADDATAVDPAPEESPAPRISESELSAMEQTFESEEWFTKTPPAETPSMRPSEDDSDFGYRPPRKRATPPVHPDQLSLF